MGDCCGNRLEKAGHVFGGKRVRTSVDSISSVTGFKGMRELGSRIFLLSLLVFGLGACATVNDPNDPAAIARYEVNDPFEEWNRAFHSVNMFADEVVVEPVARGYTTVVPKPARQSVTNFMNNITSPVTLANDLLQFEFGRAATTLSRLAVNSTVGIGGIFDPATRMGLNGHREDFGQTLAVYGFGEGFFFMAPFLGPAPPRDLVGIVVDSAINPLNYAKAQDAWMLRIGLATFDTVNARAENLETLENLERTSLDYYATLRSMYRQNRKAEIANGRDLNDSPFEFEFDNEDAFGLEEEDEFDLGEDEDMFFMTPTPAPTGTVLEEGTPEMTPPSEPVMDKVPAEEVPFDQGDEIPNP